MIELWKQNSENNFDANRKTVKSGNNKEFVLKFKQVESNVSVHIIVIIAKDQNDATNICFGCARE